MKCLVIRLSSIGDIVLASPAFRCLKLQRPDIELHLLTKDKFKAVTEANPYIDRFHYFTGDLHALIRSLKHEQFDYIIDLHKNLRTYRMRASLQSRWLSFSKLSVQKFLLTKFGIDNMPHRHISLRSLDALQPLGVKDDGEGLDYFIPSGVGITDKPLPAFTRGGYIALVIGATYATKKLPDERLAELCDRIQKPIVLVGGPEDAEAGQRIAKGRENFVFNACGSYNLHQSAILVRDSKLVISHDTGMQYIASAFHKPILAIWGGTSPKLQVEPFYGTAHEPQHQNFLVEGLTCQPCSNYGTKKCPEGHFSCMRKLDLGSIADTANSWWLR